MKKNVMEFIRRGLIACGFGPIVLAIVYLVLQKCAIVETLTVNEVCLGIFSLSALAFIAGGINVVYQVERLPLMVAILIHGGVLYVSYLVTYLINNWLARGIKPVLVFTVIFILGYFIIWAVIYSTTKKSTAQMNEKLKKNQTNLEDKEQ